MSREQFQLAKRLLVATRDMTGEQRSAHLEQVCGDDPELRAEVESLLGHAQATGAADLLDARTALIAEAFAGIGGGESESAAPSIGRYRIVGTLGEGGMGVVYLAEQTQPIRRRVAIKVIKLGMDTKQVIARFEAERQALAMMSHPNIARVIDAGATDTGRPYFVMELAQGRPITRSCDGKRLAIRPRLDLFVDVCHAVQHAHQKGIIHRDLKPSNVIVTEQDDAPVVKVIDFGIAKATHQRLTELTLMTEQQQLVGTPAYMSPEQVEGSQDIDTRTDIYSLGVLLYELLTGTTPVDPTTVQKVSYAGIRRLILDSVPVKPSTRISRLSRAEDESRGNTIAAARHTDAGTLRRHVRGDLDWIVMKALEKEPARRYETASELAADIRRHLRSEAVLAGPPSTVYLVRKFVRRNRVLVAAAAVITMLVAGFSAAMYLKSEEAVTARDLAQSEARRADRELRIRRIETGRSLAAAGKMQAAEEMLWREFLRDPASDDARWALWDLYVRYPLIRTTPPLASSGWLYEFRFDATGSTFFTAGPDEHVRVWDTRTLQVIDVLEGHENRVRRFELSPDGHLAASGDYLDHVIIWNLDTHKPLHKLVAPLCPSFSPDGRRLALSNDDEIRFWDIEQESFSRTRPSLGNVMFYSPRGDVIVAFASSGVIELWDADDISFLAALDGHVQPVRTKAFNPDGTVLATGSGSGDETVRVWDIASRSCIARLVRPTSEIRQVRFINDGRSLLVASFQSIDQWDAETWRLQRTIPSSGAWGIAQNPHDGSLLTGYFQGVTRVWEGQNQDGVLRFGGHQPPVAAAIAPDGAVLVSGDGAGVVRLWKIGTRALLHHFDAHEKAVTFATFNADGSCLATTGDDGRVRLWNADSGVLMWEAADVLTHRVGTVGFDAEGRRLFYATGDGVIRVLDIASRESRGLTEPLGSVRGLRCAGHVLVASIYNRGFRLFSDSGEPTLATPRAWNRTGFAVAPDASRIAGSVWHTNVQIWNLSSSTATPGISLASKLEAGLLAFRPNWNQLATGSADGALGLWDVASGHNLLRLEPFDGWPVTAISFSTDGKTLVAAGQHEDVTVIDLEYYDRHIAGNLEYQIAQFEDELGDDIKLDALMAWRDEVMKRSWPRLGTANADDR